MSDLRTRTNAAIEAQLESVQIFDPASLDVLPANALPPSPVMLVDEALQLDDGRTSRQYADGTSWPYAPFEVIL